VAGIVVGLALSTVILVRPYTAQVVTNVFIDVNGAELPAPAAVGEYSSKQVEERLQRFEELMKELHPPHFQGSGPRLLADEVVMKAPVHYAVVMSSKRSAGMMDALRSTWTEELSHDVVTYYVPAANTEAARHLDQDESAPASIVKLSDDKMDEIEVLQHTCRHKLNSTKWFFFGYDTAYVKTRELESYLLSLEAFQHQLSYLGKPVKRESLGRVCLPGPGSILSYPALSELCLTLSGCTDMKDHLQTDCVLGECLLKQLPHIQCSKEGHPTHLFLNFDSTKKGPIIDPRNKVVLQQALTIYPSSRPQTHVQHSPAGGHPATQ